MRGRSGAAPVREEVFTRRPERMSIPYRRRVLVVMEHSQFAENQYLKPGANSFDANLLFGSPFLLPNTLANHTKPRPLFAGARRDFLPQAPALW